MNFYSHDIYQPFLNESFTLCASLDFSTLLALSSSWNVLITTFLSLSRSSLLKQTKCTNSRALDEEAVEKRNIEQKYVEGTLRRAKNYIMKIYFKNTLRDTVQRHIDIKYRQEELSRASQPVLLVWMFTLHRSNYNWIKVLRTARARSIQTCERENYTRNVNKHFAPSCVIFFWWFWRVNEAIFSSDV